MASQSALRSHCEGHALQRSLYRHALNSLRLAARSDCGSDDARELAQRCAEMLRAADDDAEQSAMAGR
jgi:hypothetical protein